MVRRNKIKKARKIHARKRARERFGETFEDKKIGELIRQIQEKKILNYYILLP